jgi:hypothetical protein
VQVAVALSTGRICHLCDGHFIDRRFQPSQPGARMGSWDPGWGAVFASLAAGEAADLDQAVPGLWPGKGGWTASRTLAAPSASLPKLRDSQSKSPIIARPSIEVDDTRHARKVKQVLQACPTMRTAWVPFADATLNAR